MLEIVLGAVATVTVAIGGWVMGISSRVAKVETYQQAQKERLDSIETQIMKRLDRIDEKLDVMANGHYGR